MVLNRKILVAMACLAPVLADCLAQEAVVDVETTAIKAADSSQKVSEEKEQRGFLDAINEFLAKVADVNEELEEGMKKAGSYIGAAYDVKRTYEVVEDVVNIYQRAADDILRCEMLTPSEQVAAMNAMTREIKKVKNSFKEVKGVAGHLSDDSAEQGKMDDGERIKVVRQLLAAIQRSGRAIMNVYQTAILTNRSRRMEQASASLSLNAKTFNVK